MPFGTMMNPEICSPRDTVISPTVKLVALTQSAAALSDKNKKILFAVIMICPPIMLSGRAGSRMVSV
jgi:hypothetical protein